jgi:maltooligosyltrehalose trehalohydrolase
VNIHAHSLKLRKAGSLEAASKLQKVTFVYDPDGRDSLSDARLVGSWAENGRYADSWESSGQAMKKMEDGTFQAEVFLDSSSHQGPWQWGVLADGPAGADRWAITQEENPQFSLSPETKEVVYRPTSLQQNGAVRKGDDLRFRYWAPHAKNVDAVLWSQDKKTELAVALERTPDGHWEGGLKDGWAVNEGKIYAYRVTDSKGESRLMVDPYARQRMGPQRGIGTLFLHKDEGREVNKFDSAGVEYTRFEVQEFPNLAGVTLSFQDEEQNPVSGESLKERLGTQGGELVELYHGSEPSDFWLKGLQADGQIKLKPQGKAFATILPSIETLKGLNYRFQGYDAAGNLLGDLNNDGQLQSEEARALAFNDPYSSQIDGKHNWQRYGLVEKDTFSWQNDNVPRMAQNPRDQVVYQIHPGSIFGSHKNVDRTSFQDIEKRLDYFKDLGVNTLQLMPVDSTEGNRDWGYIGSHNLSVTENYGFADEKGQWVQGDEALRRLVDAAHGKGFKVFGDVVYNHFGGDFNNVWNVGGEENPWFEWSDSPAKPGASTKPTPWGALPAYNKAPVREFITNQALHRLDEFHLDGLRFDFTHPIHDQGASGGGDDGWEMLQQINRTIDLFHPNAFMAAEEFPNHPVIVTPPHKGKEGGAGFDAMWNTEFQHRLINDHGNPSVLQEAAQGRHTRIDKLMNQLLHQPGFGGPSTSVTVISNHDEVGNADRTLNVANLHRDPNTAGSWEKGAARTTLGIGMLSPGMPMMFQGEESLATNNFKWGIPSTWDNGWDWMDQPDSPRFKHHAFTKDLLHLRKSSDAFDADSQATRVYTHELDSVLAYSRKIGDEEFLVVASLNKEALENYALPVEGRWSVALNSDDPKYGGEGRFSSTEMSDGRVDLAPASVVVLRKR